MPLSVNRHSRTAAPDKVYKAAGLEIYFERRMIYVDGEEVHLTHVEYQLLSLLAENSGKVSGQSEAARLTPSFPVSAVMTRYPLPHREVVIKVLMLLAICKTIITAHHGTLIGRNHKCGAEFIFTLPKTKEETFCNRKEIHNYEQQNKHSTY